MKNSSGYYILGILATVLSTPLFIYIITLNSSDFEGASALAQIYLLPVVFILFLLIWLAVHKMLSKQPGYYLKIKLVFLFLSLISVGLFGSFAFQDHKKKISKKRNTTSCQERYKEAYDGMIVAARANYLTVRKMDDPEYDEFNYFFKIGYEVSDNFYVGQRLSKQADNKTFLVNMRDGGTQEFVIPCYKR